MHLSTDDTKVANELSRLVDENYNKIKDINPIEHSRFQMSAVNILEIGFGVNSSFCKHFMQSYEMTFSLMDDPREQIKQKMFVQIGILQAALDALNRGLTKDLFYEREMIVFSDLLGQADEFLENQRTYLAAGVYGRIVLETTIRELAKLKMSENYNPEMKFDQIIIKLRDGGFILKTLEERLRSYYTIGSDAAHDSEDFKKYSKKQLNDFLTFIRDNVLTLK
ncbi:MAG: hypothetical protein ACYDEF_16430 [Methanosarcina sp.]